MIIQVQATKDWRRLWSSLSVSSEERDNALKNHNKESQRKTVQKECGSLLCCRKWPSASRWVSWCVSVRADHKRADEKLGGGDETATKTKTKAPFRSSIKSHSTEVLRKLRSVTHISRAWDGLDSSRSTMLRWVCILYCVLRSKITTGRTLNWIFRKKRELPQKPRIECRNYNTHNFPISAPLPVEWTPSIRAFVTVFWLCNTGRARVIREGFTREQIKWNFSFKIVFCCCTLLLCVGFQINVGWSRAEFFFSLLCELFMFIHERTRRRRERCSVFTLSSESSSCWCCSACVLRYHNINRVLTLTVLCYNTQQAAHIYEHGMATLFYPLWLFLISKQNPSNGSFQSSV